VSPSAGSVRRRRRSPGRCEERAEHIAGWESASCLSGEMQGGGISRSGCEWRPTWRALCARSSFLRCGDSRSRHHLSPGRETRAEFGRGSHPWSYASPERWPPPVEDCEIVGPRSRMRTPGLEGIKLQVDGMPAFVERFARGRIADVCSKPIFHGSYRGVLRLCLDQRRGICSSCEVRPAQLNLIVLPETDRADVVGTWWLRQGEVTTAWAWKVRHMDKCRASVGPEGAPERRFGDARRMCSASPPRGRSRSDLAPSSDRPDAQVAWAASRISGDPQVAACEHARSSGSR
jgi:hypothetical protein